jgi:hypothetical protein
MTDNAAKYSISADGTEPPEKLIRQDDLKNGAIVASRWVQPSIS